MKSILYVYLPFLPCTHTYKSECAWNMYVVFRHCMPPFIRFAFTISIQLIVGFRSQMFFLFFFTQTRVQLSGPHRTNKQQTVPVCVDTEKRGGLTRGCLFALNSWQFVSSQFVVPWESARPPSLERWWGGTVHHIPAGSCQPLPGADGTYTV